MGEEIMEELIPRAEIFRSKLIEDFQLLERIQDTGRTEMPKYYSNELSDGDTMKIMLKEESQSLVKFQVYNKRVELTYTDKRLNRIKTKNAIPFGPWARMVVEDIRVQNFMSTLILINSIVLGIQAELSNTTDKDLKRLQLVLDIFDYFSLVVFILEILMKWIDGFWPFWENGWNIFDFFVTVMSFVPEIIKVASGNMSTDGVTVIAENLRVFRILRSLKMVSRFAQLRIIVLTILKAFKSMAFILILLSTFMYIFAVAGTVIFQSHAKSTRDDLTYKDSFSSLLQSWITLFQLFTLDHWFDILNDLEKVVNELTAKAYIILWICIGAFIFRNIFAGIMVMNFQSIKSDFAEKIQEQTKAIEEAEMRFQLEEELERQDRRHSISRRTSLGMATDPEKPASRHSMSHISEESTEEQSEDDATADGNDKAKDVYQVDTHNNDVFQFEENRTNTGGIDNKEQQNGNSSKTEEKDKHCSIDMDEPSSTEYIGSAEWNATVHGNLHNLANNVQETLWPRDDLFRYFQLMEALQENLAERQELHRLAGGMKNTAVAEAEKLACLT